MLPRAAISAAVSLALNRTPPVSEITAGALDQVSTAVKPTPK